jgi:gas vesicle protein
MNTGKLIIGLLLGAGAGLLAGLLIAPQKGVETRKKISDMGTRYTSAIKEKLDEAVDTLSQKLSKAKYDVSDFARNLKKGNSVEIN